MSVLGDTHYNDYQKQWRENNPEYAKQWRENNPERAKTNRKRWKKNNPDKVKTQMNHYKDSPQWKAYSLKSRLKSVYKLTLKEYNDMLIEQGGVCVLCGNINRGGKRLAVDHDHLTGEIRGLLCTNCNTAVGFMRDSPAILRKAADYLERSGAKTADGEGYIPVAITTAKGTMVVLSRKLV